MDVWPALPLIVGGDVFSISGTDNIIAVLWQSNRVCHVDLWDLAGWQLIGRSLDCDARAIPGADTSMGHVPVIPTPARLQLVWTSHFRGCQDCFCLLLTLSNFGSPMLLIPGIFHPKR